MAFRKSFFEKTGYFDERLDVGAAGCNGDSEMWYRILAEGGAIQYNPRAVVSHYHREALDKLQKQIFSYMRGFTAAVLIQHQRWGHRGNLKHLFLELPKYYAFLLMRGFPRYRGRFTTIFSEMKGMLSGLIFYLKNRNTPSNIK
jgi:GT2 family glycosyltransferase